MLLSSSDTKKTAQRKLFSMYAENTQHKINFPRIITLDRQANVGRTEKAEGFMLGKLICWY